MRKLWALVLIRRSQHIDFSHLTQKGFAGGSMWKEEKFDYLPTLAHGMNGRECTGGPKVKLKGPWEKGRAGYKRQWCASKHSKLKGLTGRLELKTPFHLWRLGLNLWGSYRKEMRGRGVNISQRRYAKVIKRGGMWGGRKSLRWREETIITLKKVFWVGILPEESRKKGLMVVKVLSVL